jgi:hypothetical protein
MDVGDFVVRPPSLLPSLPPSKLLCGHSHSDRTSRLSRRDGRGRFRGTSSLPPSLPPPQAVNVYTTNDFQPHTLTLPLPPSLLPRP